MTCEVDLTRYFSLPGPMASLGIICRPRPSGFAPTQAPHAPSTTGSTGTYMPDSITECDYSMNHTTESQMFARPVCSMTLRLVEANDWKDDTGASSNAQISAVNAVLGWFAIPATWAATSVPVRRPYRPYRTGRRRLCRISQRDSLFAAVPNAKYSSAALATGPKAPRTRQLAHEWNARQQRRRPRRGVCILLLK